MRGLIRLNREYRTQIGLLFLKRESNNLLKEAEVEHRTADIIF